LKSPADTTKCVENALEQPVFNRFLVTAVRFNAPHGGDVMLQLALLQQMNTPVSLEWCDVIRWPT
jgi:hypothetical protein